MPYHIAQKGRYSGQSVKCPAQVACTLKNKDGSPAPHFSSREDGNEWIQAQNAEEFGGSHLRGATRKTSSRRNEKDSAEASKIINPEIVSRAYSKLQIRPGINEIVSQSLSKILAESLDDTDPRTHFIKTALMEKVNLGESEDVKIFVVADKNKKIVAAASVNFNRGENFDDSEDEFGSEDEWNEDDDYEDPPHAYLSFMGSQKGNGAVLVSAIRKEAAKSGLPVYLQATPVSVGFWKKQGVVIDPNRLGIDLYGWKD